jgi:hypothetical protein
VGLLKSTKKDLPESIGPALICGVATAVLLLFFRKESFYFLAYLICAFVLMAISLLRHAGLVKELKDRVFKKGNEASLGAALITSVGLGVLVVPAGRGHTGLDVVLMTSFLWAAVWVSFKQAEISEWREWDQGGYWTSVLIGFVCFFVLVTISGNISNWVHETPRGEGMGWFVRVLYIVAVAILSTASFVGLAMLEAIATAQKASQEIVTMVKAKLSAAGIKPTRKNVDLYMSEGAEEVVVLAAKKAEEIGMPVEFLLLSGKSSFIDMPIQFMAGFVGLILNFPFMLAVSSASPIRAKQQPEKNRDTVIRGLRLF